ncbi:50S ribosomal protein L25 [Phycisphaeraceae bacterium D3-23]
MATATIPTLDTQAREKLGTRYAKREREAGRTPAVIYGHKQDPVHVTVDSRAFNDVLHGEAHLIDVSVDGKSEHVLIKALQWDTFSRFVVHVDLERVNLSESVEVEVELVLIGEPKALNQSGVVLDHPTTMVGIKCRADQIPSHLEHNIASLEMGDPVTVADLTPPAGVEITSSPEQLICQISGVKVSASVEEALEGGATEATEDGAEPAVIGKDEDAEGEDKGA